MGTDHHVIGSRFADDVNVINVTATDLNPILLSFLLKIFIENHNIYLFRDEAIDDVVHIVRGN